MSGLDVHPCVPYFNGIIELGALRSIHTHVGVCDGKCYADINCQHGRISLTSDALLQLVYEGRRALVAAKRKGRR
jgi:hypothetical protein